MKLESPHLAAFAFGLININSFDYEFTYANSIAGAEIYLVTNGGFPVVYASSGDAGSSGLRTYFFDQPYSGSLNINVEGSVSITGTLQIRNMLDTNPVAAVPEPESYAMVLAGLGVLGAVARRRGSRKTVRVPGVPV